MKTVSNTLAMAAILLAAWQILHLAAGNGALTSPWDTVRELASLLGSAAFWPHLFETLRALVLALVIGVAGGLALGMALGVHRLAREVAEPILLNLYSLPKVTLYPLVLLVFGLGLPAKVAFGVMHGLIPITVFTMSAIAQMRPVFLRVSATLRLAPMRAMWHIVLPAILPEVVAGLRLGFSLTLLGVLIGEMFASQRGLGYLLTNAMNLGDIKTIMAVALLLVLFALVCNGLLMRLGRRLSHH
ncbi:MAG TPA: ABC transporter permease subunit [Bordetella sp.]